MQYDFNLNASGGQKIDVAGRFFKYKSGVGSIRVVTSQGGYVDLLPGQGVWNTTFDSLMIKDISGAANKGVLLAGSFDFHDDRIAGTVDVVDGGKSRTIAGIAYIATVYASVTAGQNASSQLWNPITSNKNIWVKAVSYGAPGTAAGGVSMYLSQTQLGTLISAVAGANKKRSGPNTVASSYKQYSVGSIFAGQPLGGLSATAPYVYQEPILIAPGEGLGGTTNNAAESLSLVFEYYEEAL